MNRSINNHDFSNTISAGVNVVNYDLPGSTEHPVVYSSVGWMPVSLWHERAARTDSFVPSWNDSVISGETKQGKPGEAMMEYSSPNLIDLAVPQLIDEIVVEESYLSQQ
jgi:hypothetical protein